MSPEETAGAGDTSPSTPTTPAAPRRGWWRRNAVALVAIAVLLPLGAFALDAIKFGYVRNEPVPLGEGAAYERGDWTIGPAVIRPLEVDAAGTPSGTRAVVVSIRVDPGHDPITCNVNVVDPADGRTWRPANFADWTEEDGQWGFCSADPVSPYQLVRPFLLPADLDGPLRVVVGVGGAGQPVDLEFAVDAAPVDAGG